MESLSGDTCFHCPSHILVYAISHALLWKTICKISKGKCNPWVEWRVLWNGWGIILLLSVTNALYFCIIWAWECTVRSANKSSTVSSPQTIQPEWHAVLESLNSPLVSGLQRALFDYQNPTGGVIPVHAVWCETWWKCSGWGCSKQSRELRYQPSIDFYGKKCG